MKSKFLELKKKKKIIEIGKKSKISVVRRSD